MKTTLIVALNFAKLWLNGLVNRNNFYCRADFNPRIFHDTHTQDSWMHMGWYSRKFHYSSFLLAICTWIYYKMSPNQLLKISYDTVNKIVWFKQDAPPPHYSLNMRNYLNDRSHDAWWDKGVQLSSRLVFSIFL